MRVGLGRGSGEIYALIAECELRLNCPIAARAALEIAAKQEPTNSNYKTGIEQVFGKESKLPDIAIISC